MADDVDPPRTAPAAQLLSSAVDLALDKGVHALSSRALATATGGSASAITYHFRSMDALRQALAGEVEQRLDAWRRRHLAAVEGGAGAMTPEGLLLALVADTMGEQRPLVLLAMELAVGQHYPLFVASERRAADDLRQAVVRLGLPAEQAVTWRDLYFGLIRSLLLDTPPGHTLSWIAPLIRRAADRMNGWPRRPEIPRPSPPRAAPALDPPATNGARRILDATIELMAEKGLFELTHRDVAARAKISLAACTYFFATKTDMVLAAVHELHRRTVARVSDPSESHAMPHGSVLPNGQLNADLIAMQNVHTAVARSSNFASVTSLLPELRERSMALERQRIGVPDLDDLDMVLWATVVAGALHPFCIPQGDLTDRLEERFQLNRDNLFGRA